MITLWLTKVLLLGLMLWASHLLIKHLVFDIHVESRERDEDTPDLT